jgi:type I restriction enzyme M protein
MAIKKSDLYSSLWASCDALRGGMDASQYKDYVLTLLFVKYISDKFKNQKFGAIKVPDGASFQDMVDLVGTPNIGDDINKKILNPIKEANNLNDFPDFNDETKLGKGKDLVETVGDLILIFNSPELDFSSNSAEGDDILGDAYEFLMRHFARDSGKSKGQFYTPAEVSRILAKVLGINESNSTAETTAYDPTCGSGSLLLKVADEAHKSISLYGQEKEISTANLAKMNMILHNNATAEVYADNTLSRPHFKADGQLKSFDYVVANPPFSLKNWSVGVSSDADEFGRFTDFGVPPEKNGDYAFLLHIIKSLKSTGKAAVVLPHGVLFRGNAEAEIRKNVIKKGFIKGIIGLPANLFYGTGIPACIIILDKENAAQRKGIFMIDASKDFVKDGDKNKLRERDIRKITDVFADFTEVEKYSRMVSFSEIANEKNDYNLNIPRYIDNQESEDLQDLFAHLHGGIPAKDVHEMEKFWAVFPAMKKDLFKVKENGYFELKMPLEETKAFILNHPQFQKFKTEVLENFEAWKTERVAHFNTLDKGCHPKEEIKTSGDLLLETFENNPLIDAYDLFQYLMNVYGEYMQDDLYSVSLEGWKAGNDWQRLIIKGKKDKNGKSAKDKTVEGLDGISGKMISPQLIIENYLAKEQKALTDFETEVENIKASLQESEEENAVEEGLFEDLDKINLTSVKALYKEKKKSILAKEEAQVFENYIALQEALAETNAFIKNQKTKIEKAVTEIYPTLSEKEIKHLVVEKKWLHNLENALHAETDKISQTLSQRIKELAERYRETLGELEAQTKDNEAKVKLHLQKMGY